jgi:hypothetical protein
MFTVYIRYISLLLFSGLVITFYRISLFSITLSINSVKAVSSVTVSKQPYRPFSLLNDIIIPLFPALDTAKYSAISNKK